MVRNLRLRCGVLFLLCASGTAFAQSKAEEWQEILNAAKKDGKVVVAGSPDPVMRNEVIPKFTSRTGIALELPVSNLRLPPRQACQKLA